MRALIIDDEPPARMALRRLLTAAPDVEIVGEAGDATTAIELAEDCAPDVLFLDIEMPGLNGFDLLAEIRHPPSVVFVTAYDRYAVRAFETNAIDYLLKPVAPAALERSLNRLRDRLANASFAISTQLLNELRSAFQPGGPSKLAVRRGRKVILIPRRDILYAMAEDKLVFLVTATERFLTDRTVSELEGMLAPAHFFRTSRSSLVNVELIQEMYPWMSSGAWRVRLTNGAEIDVSRDRVPALRALVGL